MKQTNIEPIDILQIERILKKLDQDSPLQHKEQIYDTATNIFTQTRQQNLITGYPIQSIYATTVYIACRQHNEPRTLQEITNTTRIKTSLLRKTYKNITKGLNINLPRTTTDQYFKRFTEQIQLPPKLQTKAEKILTLLQENNYNPQTSPNGTVATIIYIITQNQPPSIKKTQDEVCELCCVSNATVRKRTKKIQEILKQIGYYD